jgi:pre-mRNA-splicing factor ISY1
MTSNVSSIKECEKWRGDILKEISRKVSKIQDRTFPLYRGRGADSACYSWHG